MTGGPTLDPSVHLPRGWPVAMSPPRSAPGPSSEQMARAHAAADKFAVARGVDLAECVKALDGLAYRLGVVLDVADPLDRASEWADSLRAAARAIDMAASYLEDAEEQEVEGP